eukprot:GHRR01029953.1.p1 GENE.GHRR01029953.1~~GHRR01029953.1.p1  ORF type:complete len:123 (-),score=12.04 GHRR01029953.1:587-955(-)
MTTAVIAPRHLQYPMEHDPYFNILIPLLGIPVGTYSVHLVLTLMFSSHMLYILSNRSGMILMSPLATAARAGLASGSMRTNHCSDTRGSTTSPPRWERGTLQRIQQCDSVQGMTAKWSNRQI